MVPTWLVVAKDWIVTLTPLWAILLAVFWEPLKRTFKRNITDPNIKNTEAIKDLDKEIKKIAKTAEDAQRINKALLHNEVFKECKEFLNNADINVDDLEHLGELFNLYESLGGNGIAAKLFNEVQNLPKKKGEKK